MARGGITNIGGVQIDQNDMKNRIKSHFATRVIPVDEQDRQIWNLITEVPLVTKPVAIGCAVVNLIFPGFGTIIAACAASDNVSKAQITIGILQSLLSLLFIGFLFAGYWSYLLVMKALHHEKQMLPQSASADVETTGSHGMRVGQVHQNQYSNLK